MPARPRRQGAFDGACGFYAVANALSLVSPKTVSRDDFSVLLEVLAPDTGLPKQFFAGTRRNEVNRMLTALVRNEKFADVSVYRPYWAGAHIGLRDYWVRLAEHFDNRSAAAIVKYAHEPSSASRYNHWTVVRGVTKSSLLLFDSDGAARISRKRARLWDDLECHKGRPYALDYTATFLLRSEG